MGKLMIKLVEEDERLKGSVLVYCFITFIAGCFFGYLWMAKAYGLI